MSSRLVLLLGLASACQETPIPPESARSDAAGLCEEVVSMPALTRRATRLAGLGVALELPAGAPVVLHAVAAPPTGGSAQACVSAGEVQGFIERADVAPLPLQASLIAAAPTEAVVVEAVEGGTLRVNLSGFFALEPSIALLGPERLDLSPSPEPLLIGDMDLAAWRPQRAEPGGGEGRVDAALTLRGLEVPGGAALRWSERGRISALELRSATTVGGHPVEAGAVLWVSQGCDFTLRAPGEDEVCINLR